MGADVFGMEFKSLVFDNVIKQFSFVGDLMISIQIIKSSVKRVSRVIMYFLKILVWTILS